MIAKNMDKYEIAKNEILEARKPFDDSLEALELMKLNRDCILQNLLQIFDVLCPEGKQFSTIREMLKSNTFPNIWVVDNNLRIDGALNKPNSLIDFLKEHSKLTPEHGK